MAYDGPCRAVCDMREYYTNTLYFIISTLLCIKQAPWKFYKVKPPSLYMISNSLRRSLFSLFSSAASAFRPVQAAGTSYGTVMVVDTVPLDIYVISSRLQRHY